jgi:hypothetical protein
VVPHSSVLESLARIGVQGKLYDWFTNYLSGRYQWVCWKGIHHHLYLSPLECHRGPFSWALSCQFISLQLRLVQHWKSIHSNSDLLTLDLRLGSSLPPTAKCKKIQVSVQEKSWESCIFQVPRVTISSDLSWNNHIISITCNRARKLPGFLYSSAEAKFLVYLWSSQSWSTAL